MRILQVLNTLAPRYGGPSIAGPELSRELVRQGHEVSIYASDVDGRARLDVPLDHPVDFHGVEIRYFRGWTSTGKYMFSPALWRALRENVTRFDIVQIWSVYSFSTTAAAYWCRKQGVPHVVFPHGSLDPYLRKRNRPRKWMYTKLFAERDYRKATGVLFNTAEEMRLASDWSGLASQTNGNGHVSNRFVVPIGLDPKWLEPPDSEAGARLRQRFSELRGKHLIVYFGRLNFKKGLDILARAFAQVARDRDDIHLVLAGPADGDYDQKVRQWLQDAGALQKTTFTGLLQGEDRFAILQQAEIFALTSYTENFGQVVAEAMACGVPVLISDQVNIWPDVAQAKAGLVVPCDVQAAAQALRTLLDDATRAREMGVNGRRWAAGHLTWGTVGAQMINAYQEILRGNAWSPVE